MIHADFWATIEQWKRDNPWFDDAMRITKECEEILASLNRRDYYETFTSGSSGVRFRWNPETQCYEEYYPENEEQGQ